MLETIDAIRNVRANAEILASAPYSEQDTIRLLIDPVLRHLGFPETQSRSEAQINRNRPDIVVWGDSAQIGRGIPAAAIIEAKPLGADLNGNGKPKQDRPKEQIARYVAGYGRAGPNTIGALTDGNIWRVVRRAADGRRVELLAESRLLDSPPSDAARALDDIGRMFRDAAMASALGGAAAATDARAFADAIADGESPVEILKRLANVSDCRTSLEGELALVGKARRAEEAHWDEYAYTTAGRVQTEQGDLSDEALCAAVVRMADAESEGDAVLHREDVALVASTFAKIAPANMSVALAIQPDEDGNPAKARVAVHYQGHTGMTAEFDPCAPPPMILSAIQRIHDDLRTRAPVPASRFVDAVDAKGLRKEFYQAVASGWTLRQYRKARGDASDRRRYREAVLRHLVRSLFAWILKEDGKLPQEAFEESFARAHARGSYHDGVLTYMFHERLNKPMGGRRPHAVSAIDAALRGVRFLNGSLFARHAGDDALRLDDDDYFGVDPERPGLFTILSEYDWTALEHTPSHSDQTIDPEVLSNLFENLIAVTEADKTPDRMPKGTYYTPADVAREMCKDALMMAVKDDAPASWTESDLLTLFGDADAPLPALTARQKSRLRGRIESLTVFDPAAGSGEFPLMSVYAVRTALEKLGRDDAGGRLTREIIGEQIHAQDVNPMAVQITRLRLFIAIIAAEKGGHSELPLPNLEAKVACADTLSTVPHRGWRPAATGGLQDAAKFVSDALAERAGIFGRWADAHEESAKENLRAEDARARARLKNALRSGMSNPETAAFAEHALLEPDAEPARIDPRLLFYREDWRGFDIVIGNPPYERIAAGESAEVRKEVRAELERGGYSTVKCNDLYALIAEAGLNLANPNGGILTFIVPLSLCFGQNKRALRELFERNSREIRLRNQDNAPPVFRESPVSNPMNRQRTTIVTAVISPQGGAPDILTTGTNKWRDGERRRFLESRAYVPVLPSVATQDARLARQWERLPTPEVAELISRMRDCGVKIANLDAAGAERGRRARAQSAGAERGRRARAQSAGAERGRRARAQSAGAERGRRARAQSAGAERGRRARAQSAGAERGRRARLLDSPKPPTNSSPPCRRAA